MAEIVPFLPSVPYQSLEVALAGASYLMNARWNARDNNGVGCWYVDVLETDGTPIAMSLKVVLGTLLGRWSHHPFFSGRGLFAIDESNTGVEATLDDFGVRVRLAYFTEADLELAAAPPTEVTI